MCSPDFPFLFHNHTDNSVPCKADQWWQPWTQLVQAEWVAVQLAVSTNFLILHGSENRKTFKIFLLNLADFAPAYMYIIISVCILLPTHLFFWYETLFSSLDFMGKLVICFEYKVFTWLSISLHQLPEPAILERETMHLNSWWLSPQVPFDIQWDVLSSCDIYKFPTVESASKPCWENIWNLAFKIAINVEEDKENTKNQDLKSCDEFSVQSLA